MKKLLLLILIISPIITIAKVNQTNFTTSSTTVNNSSLIKFNVEWSVSDSLLTYKIIDKKIVKRMNKLGQSTTVEYKCVFKESAPNYYIGKMNQDDTSIRIKVILTDKSKPVVSIDMRDSFTEKTTSMLYFNR